MRKHCSGSGFYNLAPVHFRDVAATMGNGSYILPSMFDHGTAEYPRDFSWLTDLFRQPPTEYGVELKIGNIRTLQKFSCCSALQSCPAMIKIRVCPDDVLLSCCGGTSDRLTSQQRRNCAPMYGHEGCRVRTGACLVLSHDQIAWASYVRMRLTLVEAPHAEPSSMDRPADKGSSIFFLVDISVSAKRSYIVRESS